MIAEGLITVFLNVMTDMLNRSEIQDASKARLITETLRYVLISDNEFVTLLPIECLEAAMKMMSAFDFRVLSSY